MTSLQIGCDKSAGRMDVTSLQVGCDKSVSRLLQIFSYFFKWPQSNIHNQPVFNSLGKSPVDGWHLKDFKRNFPKKSSFFAVRNVVV